VLASRCGVTTNLKGGQSYLGNPAQPLRQELKVQALQRRIPKLMEEIKTLKQSVHQLDQVLEKLNENDR
jgi:UDP-3-O-[3-hydroxymyristoyl] glucosamine N-acyltransferase